MLASIFIGSTARVAPWGSTPDAASKKNDVSDMAMHIVYDNFASICASHLLCSNSKSIFASYCSVYCIEAYTQHAEHVT